MADIYCFGDSITRGENDPVRGGWADRLKSFYIRRHLKGAGQERCVFNLGIGGETTAGLRRRFPSELRTRLDSPGRSIVVLAYGANDAAQTRDGFLVPIGAYVANLSFCIDLARKLECETLLLSITPVSPAADGVRNPSGRVRKNSFIERYNNALRGLAARKKAGMIDVYSEFMKRDPRSLFVPDGVHPNAAGHALIYRAVKRGLEEF